MSKLLNPRKVKAGHTYTYEEASEALCIAVVTVRSWVRSGGLEAMTSQRPHLMRGSSIRAFLESQRATRRKKMELGEFYCLSCREVRKPLGDMVDCTPNAASSLRLIALCCECETQMNRFVPLPQIRQWHEVADLSFKSDVDA